MALLDRQRKGREIGRIRIGITVTTQKGRTRPEKLDRFRFTSRSRVAIATIADLFGGEAHDWDGHPGEYEVVTKAAEIPVAVPPSEAFINQDYELWTGGGCARRCDGVTARLYRGNEEKAVPCVCPADLGERMVAAADGNACKPTTRLNIIIPDVEGLGVWRLETHGNYAADELAGTAELMAKAREAGVTIPAVLRLEQRQGARRPGREPHKFVVPVLEPLVSLRALVTGNLPSDARMMLPPDPAGAKAITAGSDGPPPPPVEPARRTQPAASAEPEVIDGEIVDESGEPGDVDPRAQQVADQALTLLGVGAVRALARGNAELLPLTVEHRGERMTLAAHLAAIEEDLQVVTAG